MHMPDIGSRILFCMINLSGPLSFQRLTRLWGWKIVNNWMFHLFIGHKNSSTYVCIVQWIRQALRYSSAPKQFRCAPSFRTGLRHWNTSTFMRVPICPDIPCEINGSLAMYIPMYVTLWQGWPDEFMTKSPKSVALTIFCQNWYITFSLEKGVQNLGLLLYFYQRWPK
jgi:hypothetical protein